MTGDVRRLQKMAGGCRRWQEVLGGERRWLEMSGGGRRWQEVAGGGWRWLEEVGGDLERSRNNRHCIIGFRHVFSAGNGAEIGGGFSCLDIWWLEKGWNVPGLVTQ